MYAAYIGFETDGVAPRSTCPGAADALADPGYAGGGRRHRRPADQILVVRSGSSLRRRITGNPLNIQAVDVVDEGGTSCGG